MMTKLLLLAGSVLALGLSATEASAGAAIAFNTGGAVIPVQYAPAPVYAAPPPVCQSPYPPYQPISCYPPVYAAPTPVYAAPVYAAPVYAAPAVVEPSLSLGFDFGGRGGGRRGRW